MVSNGALTPVSASAKVWFRVTGPGGFSQWVGYDATVGGQSASSSEWYSYDWTVPGGAPSGTYSYYARVYDGSQALTSASAEQSFQVGCSGGVCTVTKLYGINGAVPGATVKLWAKVKNDTGSAAGSTAKVWFSVDGSWIYPGVSFAGLAAGSETWYYLNWTIPGGFGLGQHSYTARLYDSSGPLCDFFSPAQTFDVSAN